MLKMERAWQEREGGSQYVSAPPFGNSKASTNEAHHFNSFFYIYCFGLFVLSGLYSPCKQVWKALSLVLGVRLLFTLVRLCQRALFCRMRPVVSQFKGFGVREEGERVGGT